MILTPEEIINKSEQLANYKLRDSETYKKLVVYPAMEEYASLERERTLNEAIDRINKETFGGMKENISTKKVIEILTKLKEGK